VTDLELPPTKNLPSPAEHPGLIRVKQMFDHGDFETIEKMVKFWEAMEKLGLLGDLLRRFVIWSGVIAGGYIVFNGYVVEWIRGISRQ
jgi:hypothetical protein